MKRPKLQSDLSPADFRKAVAAHAAELDRWIELSVDAFPSDPIIKANRLKKVRDPKTGFRFFVETYLPHYVKGDASLFHEAVFERFPEILFAKEGNKKKGANELFVAPRGSSKSTHLSLGGALYAIALGLERYILEICDVYSQAALLIEAIKSELTSNPRLSFDFPEVCGAGRVWREGEIVTKNDIRVEGIGALQKIRGRRHGPFRPSLVFLDDLENDENVRSPEQRKKLEGWVDRAVGEVGPPDGSLKVIYVGTILHFDAVIARKAKSAAWRTTKFQAIMSWPDDMDLWSLFEEAYHNDGPDAAKAFYAENKKAMDVGAVVNWPSMQPLMFLMLKRANSHSSFATEYQNQPISEGNPFTNLTYWVQRRSNLIHFGAIDPSLGKKGHGRDPSAILIGGYDRETGVMDLLVASIRKRLPDIIISDTIAFQREYRCQLWFVEAVQFQEFLRTSLMKEAAKAHVALPAMPVIPHADKDLRIERLQPPMTAGLIRINASQTTFIDQLQQWPNAAHDDGPDCLDMLWQNALTYSAGAPASGRIATSGARSSTTATEGFRIK
jgi:predicted phage terminase large subunit-like protein